MKNILAALCLIALILCLAGCQKTQTPSSIPGPASESAFGASSESASGSSGEKVTVGEIPRMDGSTANIPMAVAMLQKLKGISQEEAEAEVIFNTTSNAYLNLDADLADLILAYEADEGTKAQITAELEYHEIGRDALVFITNKNNTAESLTTEQIRGIYQGSITNWKMVGGSDAEIIAYQRTPQSGSQALMEKLIMKGDAMTSAPQDLIQDSMMGLIESLASYKNESNALGYSVYYYASAMYANESLKFLKVDGVMPSNDTIRDQSYPHTNPFYAVIRKDAPEGSPARKMLAWILSDEGRQTMVDAGYVVN